MRRKYVLLILLFAGLKFALAQAPDITALEYYFDTDPGFGNGMQISVSPGTLVDMNVDFDITSLSNGAHKLYVRTRDENGHWSLAFKKEIYKLEQPSVNEPLPDIVHAEYYFDTDPGFGNGISIPVTIDSIIDENFDFDIASLSAGAHKLFVRTRDENGRWSLAFKKEIYKLEQPPVYEPLPDIVQAEYYFDTDPGFGNGISIPVTIDSIIDENFDFDIASLSAGAHKLFVRTRDENGRWSLAFKKEIYKLEQPPVYEPLPDIVQAEYYFDTDPGFGNGINIPVTIDSIIDENFDFDIASLSAGAHRLFVRTRDENGRWSLAFEKEVYKLEQPPVYEPLPDIVQAEYFIDTDPGHGNGFQVPFAPDSVVDFSFLADISFLTEGGHYLYCRVKDENSKWSHLFAKPFYWLDIKAFLEGPYNEGSGEMNTYLNGGGLLPLTQPFNTDTSAVWYYEGSESVTTIPNQDIIDWILLQTRYAGTPQNADTASIIETRPAFITKDGAIVGLDGSSSPFFLGSVGNLYLVIYHRNHLAVMSSNPVPMLGTGSGSYDFTTSSTQAYGGINAHKQIGPGIWGLAGGDGSPDGNVNNNDKNDVWAPQAGTGGYLQGDFNMDGQTNNTDKNDIWSENGGLGSQVPDSSVKTESIPD